MGRLNEFSIAFTFFFLKLSGLWVAENSFEERCRRVTIAYSIFVIFCHCCVITTDTYYCRGDFGVTLYNLSNVLSTYMSVFKLLCLLTQRKDFHRLIRYMRREFLNGEYDPHERSILAACKGTSTFYICTFSSLSNSTLMSYVISPIIVNIGRNESDRIHPFNVRLDLPLAMTPYFEIIFILQAFALYQTGICYFTFDNTLCMFNLHAAGQFRILQYRLETMRGAKITEERTGDLNACPSRHVDIYYEAFKTHVRQHQELIAFCNRLENVFSFYSLGQVLLFSLLICLDGYMILVAEVPVSRRFIFVFHLIACIAQLFMFTYSCDRLIQDSTSVARAMYAAPWTDLPMNKDGSRLRKEMVLVMIRSRQPSCLTGYGFFAISLETYTRVLSTAFSYFTLLRQGSTTMK
ncbi:odorant receptor 13a-like [Hylaeus volcanicus]|uniref:odorant receptor 13a-like n=1 Tax=Hylaeus volcanicus TaxID=313075 RepID=UPI0023B88041|nr:odorant receptor 13a-like [Hylaeus volcanicus]